jgi:hypothetical protein
MDIDINIESQVSQTITDGVTDKAPSENAVFDALANKVDTSQLAGLVPYTGAVADVNLGTHKLTAHNLVVNHPSGSGDAATITKGGNGEALKVVKSSGSGNAASITGGVTLLSELNLTTKLADTHIASASTWNAKIGGAVSIGQVAFGTASGVGGDAGLFWDNTNKRLGVGTSAPTTKLTIQDSNTSILRLRGDVGSGGIFITQPGNNSTFFAIGDDVNILGSTVNTLVTYFSLAPQRFFINGAERMRVNATGNLGIGTSTPTARLHVQSQGALSTDIGFRVRNSANTLDIIRAQGDGEVNFRNRLSLGLYSAGSAKKLYISRDAETFGVDVEWSGANTVGAQIVNTGSGNNIALLLNSYNGTQNLALSIANGNISMSGTAGTKIGISTSQKIAFWNATPIVQPTTAVTEATFVANTGNNLKEDSTFDGYTMKQVVKALRNMGILA